jgi:hypothetical protein
MTSMGKKTSRIISFFLGVLIVYMLTQPFVGSINVYDAVHDQSGPRIGSTNKYRYYAFGGSGNTVKARLAILGNYSYDRVSFLSGGTLQFDMTSQYLSLANNQFMFQVWNTTNGANPQVSIILPIAPTFVLNALDYSYSGGAVTIDGRQSNQTVTMNVGSLSSTKTIKIPSSTASLSAVSYSEGPSQLTIQCSQGSGNQVTVTGASQSPLKVSLNGSPSPSWSYASGSDMLTLNGVGKWVVSYAPTTTTTTSTSTTTNTSAAPFNFSLSNTGGITVTPGGSGSNVITVTLASGSPLGVSLSCSGLPSGASCSLNPSSGNPTYQSVLTISTSGLTLPGSYPIKVTGVGGPNSNTTSFMLTVGNPAFDFSLSALPLPSLQPGDSGSTTIQVNLLSGVPQYVSLSCGNLTLGFTCSFHPAVSLPTPTFPSTLTVSTTSSTPLGSWPITVMGTAGNLSRTVQLSITITALTQIPVTFNTNPNNFQGSSSAGSIGGCGGSFTDGQSSTSCPANFSATATPPPSGWQFHHWEWSGGISCSSNSTNPTNCSVSGSSSLKAVFAAQITFQTNPSGEGGSIGWGSCSNPVYVNGQSIFDTNLPPEFSNMLTICANVPSGWTFGGWSTTGGLSVANSSASQTVATFTGPANITAAFTQKTLKTQIAQITQTLTTGIALSNKISTSISAAVSPSQVQEGAQFTVSGNLTVNGVGVGGEKVLLVFGWNATAVTVTTQSDGSYTYSANAPEQNGSYNIQVNFSGDIEGTTQYLPSTATAKVSVS